MIPPITPPTDNLYKFISLFGLTILLFSVYNVGITYDYSAANQLKIEDVKVELQQKYYLRYETLNSSSPLMHKKEKWRPLKLQRMERNLVLLEKEVDAAELDELETYILQGKIRKLSVSIDTLRIKYYGYLGFAVLGCSLMTFGFVRWHSREQKLRDKMLTIEHALKELERGHFGQNRKRKKKKVHEIKESIIETPQVMN